jgi:hypothetical protein
LCLVTRQAIDAIRQKLISITRLAVAREIERSMMASSPTGRPAAPCLARAV